MCARRLYGILLGDKIITTELTKACNFAHDPV